MATIKKKAPQMMNCSLSFFPFLLSFNSSSAFHIAPTRHTVKTASLLRVRQATNQPIQIILDITSSPGLFCRIGITAFFILCHIPCICSPSFVKYHIFLVVSTIFLCIFSFSFSSVAMSLKIQTMFIICFDFSVDSLYDTL